MVWKTERMDGMSEWQPIEDFSPDSDKYTSFAIVFAEDCVGEAEYHPYDGEWWWIGDYDGTYIGEQIYPTHWMPLPKPPETA